MISELDWMVKEAMDLIEQGIPFWEAVDATVLSNDLTDGEKRGMIHLLSKEGYKHGT